MGFHVYLQALRGARKTDEKRVSKAIQGQPVEIHFSVQLRQDQKHSGPKK